MAEIETAQVEGRGVESFADDLVTGRGVVFSRAATILRSVETKPSIGRFAFYFFCKFLRCRRRLIYLAYFCETRRIIYVCVYVYSCVYIHRVYKVVCFLVVIFRISNTKTPTRRNCI